MDVHRLKAVLVSVSLLFWLAACDDATDSSPTDGGGALIDADRADGGTSSEPDGGVDVDGATPNPDAGPGPGPTESFSFLAYGDSRAGSGCDGNGYHARLVQRMDAETDWDFVINLGDMVAGYDDSTCFVSEGSCNDPSSHGDFSRIIAPLASRPAPAGLPTAYIPVIGNHDDNAAWYPDPCGGRICDVFDMEALVAGSNAGHDVCNEGYPSRAYYSFVYGGVLFIVLRINSDYFNLFECNYPREGYSTCESYCRDAPPSATRSDTCYHVHQYDWLVSTLQSAAADPSIRHRVVLQHAPVYTTFDDHPPVASSPILRDVFDTYGVDLLLNGHNHTYERMVPIRGGVEDATGTVYITTGSAGGEAYSPAGGALTAAMSNQHHYMRIDVDDTGIHGRAISMDGEMIDAF